MAGKVFLDTNVLLRASIAAAPLHREAQRLVLAQPPQTEMWISRQVLREYIVTLTRPQSWMPSLSSDNMHREIDAIRALYQMADETEQVTLNLLALIKEIPVGGKQIHDANIVATMIAYGIDTLLTANVDDMKRFASKIKIIPLPQNQTP